MRILVVDDEPLARERIVSLIQDLHAGTVVGQAGNGIEALEAVHGLNPDIVLLDIRMPGMDGMETAHHLARTDNPPAVLFATAYDDHAVDAFEASAVDYLLKPVRKERLQQSLDRAAVLNQARMAAIKEAEPLARKRHRTREPAPHTPRRDPLFPGRSKVRHRGLERWLCPDRGIAEVLGNRV